MAGQLPRGMTLGSGANPFIQKAMNETNQAVQPYAQFANKGSAISQQYDQMMNDPVANLQNIRNQYQQTPGHKKALEDSIRMANNAAVAGGMLGSPLHQDNVMESAAAVNDKYERQWVDRILNRQQFGTQGNQGLFDNSMKARMYANDINAQGNSSMGNYAESNNRRNSNYQNDAIAALMKEGTDYDGNAKAVGSSTLASLGGMAGGALGAQLLGSTLGSFAGPVGTIAGTALGKLGGDYFFGGSNPATAATTTTAANNPSYSSAEFQSKPLDFSYLPSTFDSSKYASGMPLLSEMMPGLTPEELESSNELFMRILESFRSGNSFASDYY